MISSFDAEVIAVSWVQRERIGAVPDLTVSEFDLGYGAVPGGTGGDTLVVDRHTGELTSWPSAPAQEVAEAYRRYRRDHPASPLTWDPVAQARQQRVRAPFPYTVAYLRLPSGRLRMGYSGKHAGTPNLHPLVRESLETLPVSERVRGGERCAEVAVLSDLLHAEEARRSVADGAALTMAAVRDDLLHGADLVTYEVREPGDPRDGQPGAPCRSCRALLRRCGLVPEESAAQ